MKKTYLKIFSFAAFLWLLVSVTFAQDYPTRPVKVIVPFSGGTALDAVTRIVIQSLTKNLGQPFFLENRGGAGSTIGTAAVATAPADGYTLLSTSPALTTAPALMPSIPYDTARDFAGVTTMVENPLVLVASKSTGIQSVRELIAAARSRPGELTFGSAGVGSSTHLSTEKFRIAADFTALHVPFRGTAEVVTEILANRIDFTITTIPSALPGIRDGRLVALAMISRRSAALPNIPTLAEAGVTGGGSRSWLGFLVPAKTPRDIVNRLNQEILKVLSTPEVRDRLEKIGLEPVTMTPEDFDALIQRELSENAQLVKAAGIKIQ